MTTFAVLADKVQLITDPERKNLGVILQYVRDAENEFIEQTQCTEKITTIDTEADFTYNVAAVSMVNDTFSIAGDYSSLFTVDRTLTIADSTGNDGTYTVSSSVYSAPNTVISVSDAVPDATADGTLTLDPQATYDLPSDFCKEIRVEWDGIKLHPIATASPVSIHQNDGISEYTGTPCNYWIEEGIIRLLLKPPSHGILKIWYIYINTATDGTSPIIPSEDHNKLVNGAIVKMMEMNGQEVRATYYQGKWDKDIEDTYWKYKMRRAKQSHVTDVNDIESGTMTWDEIRTSGFDSGFGK